MIVRQGTDNGAWFAKRHLWVQNENTHRLPDYVDRRSFEQLLAGPKKEERSPQAGLHSIHLRDGFEIEQVAAEPLVMDPVSTICR